MKSKFMRVRDIFILSIFISVLVSCDMIEYHPYDTHISGETGLTDKNIALITEQTQGRSEFRFAVISDTQRWYDETEDVVTAINARGDIDFVIHTGDLSDFGAKLEFELQRDILNKLNMPYVCLIGNRDCIATGDYIFQKIFGATNFAFTAGDVRFICLNTNALEFDRSIAVPDYSFIEAELRNYPTEAKRTIVAMHAGPFSEQFDNNTAPLFHYAISRFPNLQFCLYGHEHQVGAKEFFNDGVIYYQCTCAKKRNYLVFTIKENGYTYESIDF